MKRTLLATALICASIPALAWATDPATPTSSASATTVSAARSASQSRSSATATGGQSRANATGGSASNAVTVNNGGGGSGGRSNGGSRTPDVLAPGISGANPCGLGAGIGGSGPGAGGLLSFMWADSGCERREKARLLYNMGERTAAKEALCFDDEARRALFSSGNPCARDAKGWQK